MMYDFIYVGDEGDYTRYCANDIAQTLENVYCCMPPQYNCKKMYSKLCNLHNSSHFTCRGIYLPFRSIWAKYILDDKTRNILLSSQNQKCFIFTAEGAKYIKMGALKYLRKVFPGCVIVCSFNDKVDLHKRRRGFSLERLKQSFDYVLSYDMIDINQYDLKKSPPIKCNYYNVPLDFSVPESDIFYVGRMKINAPDRLDTLIHLYEIARLNNLKCDFYISGVPKEKQKYPDEIHYNHVIPYVEVLKHVKRTKAVINIVQNNVDGLTLRDFEAIGMNKILISNNSVLKNSLFFNNTLFIEDFNFENKIKSISEKTIAENHWSNVVQYDINEWNDWIYELTSSNIKNH